MEFAHPYFLFALSALAVPIIVHLFNFRRYRKVYFTNVKFLEEIRQETRKHARLKNLLILLMRLLAVTCLVLAFARPFLPSSHTIKNPAGQKAVSIYIDNSFSMEALSSTGKLIELAKNKAVDIISAYKPSDQFQLITNDFEGRQQRFVSPEEFKAMVEEVHVTPITRNLGEVAARMNDLQQSSPARSRDAVFISDFQKTTGDPSTLPKDTVANYFFVPLAAQKTNNLYIDSAWFSNPVQQPSARAELHVRIKNASDEKLEKIPVRLSVNNAQKSLASFSVDPNAEAGLVMSFTNNASGFQYGQVELTDYPVTFDDKLFFAYSMSPSIPVLCISGKNENPFLDALFRNDSGFVFREVPVTRLDYSSLNRYSLIILDEVQEFSSGLNQELDRFLNNGGTVVILPDAEGKATAGNPFLAGLGLPQYGSLDTASQKVTGIATESEVYNDVFEKNAAGKIIIPENADLPVVKRHYHWLPGNGATTEPMLRLMDGEMVFGAGRAGKGMVYLFAFPMDENFSNFPKHILFFPTFYKVALLSTRHMPLYSVIGKNDFIELPPDTLSDQAPYRISAIPSGMDFIPEARRYDGRIRLLLHGQIKEAGFYSLKKEGRDEMALAFNYDHRESDLKCFTPAELSGILQHHGLRYFAVLKDTKAPLKAQIAELSLGKQLWKWFVLGALLFLLGEILIVRFMKD